MADVGEHAGSPSNDNERVITENFVVQHANRDERNDDIVAKLTVSLDIDELLAEAGLSGHGDQKTSSAKDDLAESAVSSSPHKRADSAHGRASQKLKNKRQRLSAAEQEEHQRLEALVLGANASELFPAVTGSAFDAHDAGRGNNSNAVELLRPAWLDDEDAADNPIEMSQANKFAKIRRANETLLTGEEYSRRLRKQFQQRATDGIVPKWASVSTLVKKIEEEEKSDNVADGFLSIVSGSEPALRRNGKILPTYAIRLKRCPLLNRARISKAAVEAVKFHPTTQVALVASWDRHVGIFQVDEEKQDSMLQNFYFAKYPITDAVFSGRQQANEVIVCSKIKPHLHAIDLLASKIIKIPMQSLSKNNQPLVQQNGFRSIAASSLPLSNDCMLALLGGKPGAIHIMQAGSKEYVLSLQMNAGVNSCVWHMRSPHCLYSIGDEGIVYLWDIRYNSRCLGKGFDQGSLKGTAIDMSASGELVAVGSSTGVVNVYDAGQLERKLSSSNTAFGSTVELEPVKVVKNLTTSITGVKFNDQSETLALWSRQDASSMRLLRTADYLPTSVGDRTRKGANEMSVFHNFPALTEPLGHVEDVNFSPSSGYMAVGNYQGRVNLYRMLHYDQY